MLRIGATKKDRAGQTANGFAQCAVCGKPTIARPDNATGVSRVAVVRGSTNILKMSL